MTSQPSESNYGLSTVCVWSAEDQPHWESSITVPISHAVTYAYPDYKTLKEVSEGDKNRVQAGGQPRHVYSRNTSPTVRVLETKMAILEGAEACTSFSTGMGAISNTLETFLAQGDKVVSIRDTYGGTAQMFLNILPRSGVEVELCDTLDEEAIVSAIENSQSNLKLVYIESPTNPTLKIVNIQRLAEKAHQKGALLVVDNTFATPINQNPLKIGADLVVHSGTKYLNGHGDAMAGFVCGSSELVYQVYHTREIKGATLDPWSAYLIIRGLKTLDLRVQRHNDNAMRIATFLSYHPMVYSVNYPGLESHPKHSVAKSQKTSTGGYGGMLSFTVKAKNSEDEGDETDMANVLDRLKLAFLAPSLGHVETLIGPPSATSHVECTREERAELGISESLIRLSVGIENVEDLINDLDNALCGEQTCPQ